MDTFAAEKDKKLKKEKALIYNSHCTGPLRCFVFNGK